MIANNCQIDSLYLSKGI